MICEQLTGQQIFNRGFIYAEHLISIKSNSKFTYKLNLKLNSTNTSMHEIIQSHDRVTSPAHPIDAVTICDLHY